MKLAIIDYGIGNTKSLINAFRKIGLDNIILTDDEKTIYNSDLIILPGVGAYGNAMLELKKRGLVICAFICMMMIGLGYRLYYLQIIKQEHLE